MTRFAVKLIILLSLVQLTGCTSFRTSNSYMSVLRAEESLRPAPGHALYLFQRDNARVAEWSALNLWEITDEVPRLVGLLHGKMKASWSVPPGEHDFMLVLGGKTQILRTRSDADKTYFVKLNHNAWGRHGPAIYTFSPIRAEDENSMTAARVSHFNDNAREWEQESLTSAMSHREKAYAQWKGYSEEEKSYFSMLPEDGR